jgi:plastocyanin
MKRGIIFLTISILLTLAVASAQDKKSTGSVRGKIRLTIKGVKFKDLGPLVVYLDAIKGKLKYEIPKASPKIIQKDAKFQPKFLVIAAGQTVDFPNEDKVDHNVFSFSKKNNFDLGIYQKGQSKDRVFKDQGVVKIYCSVHSSMNAVIFVAPSPYHTIADSSGSFEIRNVPPGRYRLRTWNNKLPAGSKKVKLTAGKVTDKEISIGP